MFVDFNQNAPHKTVFGAWFVRPRVGGQVSTPLGLGRGRIGRTPKNSPSLPSLSWSGDGETRGRPWSTSRSHSQPLLDMAARDRENGLHDAPWPPEYPKQPDEPPRVAPSRAKKG